VDCREQVSRGGGSCNLELNFILGVQHNDEILIKLGRLRLDGNFEVIFGRGLRESPIED
jgi:hypothetical protein